ncbi:hypothetical protein NH340_JMT04203 [Sarcoptes scabiei]|nr:hypothetical protein NH340_JMT04203 [Sarcoptes scabiei]
MKILQLISVYLPLFWFHSASANFSSSNENISYNNLDWINQLENGINQRIDIFRDRLNRILANNISTLSFECRTSLKRLIVNPFETDWSLKMWDSMGHFPHGILSGTFFDPGNYDQCLSISDEIDALPIQGKYCVMEFRLNKTIENRDVSTKMDPNWIEILRFLNKWSHYSGIDNGICLPSQCSDEEIQTIVSKIFMPFDSSVRVRSKLCQDQRNKLSNLPLRAGQWIVLYILLGHIGLVIIGTLIGLFIRSERNCKTILIETLRCFSFVDNTNALFKIKRNKLNDQSETSDSRSPGSERSQLRFVHGLRVFSIYWILIAHVFLFYPMLNVDDRVSPVHSMNRSKEVIGNIFTHLIVNAGLAVETFFLIRQFNDSLRFSIDADRFVEFNLILLITVEH